MQENKNIYTSREEVELLLQETLEDAKRQGGKKKLGKKKKAEPMKMIRRLLYGLIVLSLLFMLGKVWVDRLSGNTPSLFGYQLYVVETGSMIPTLPIGSFIIVRGLNDVDEPAVGDIITYAHEAAVITHRITELVPDKDGVLRYQTKGDNPDNSSDPWLVERENIRGIVIWHFSLFSR